MRKGLWKKKLGLALLGLVVITPPLVFGISNLFLVSPKGRALIAEKIALRLQLDASVLGATWSPWNGITVYGLRVEQPGALGKAMREPLLSVESVRIHPDWLSLTGKKPSLKGVDLVKPHITIPIELLSQIPQKEAEPPLVAKAPELAAAQPAAGDAPPQQRPAQPRPPDPGIVPGMPMEQKPQVIVKSASGKPAPAVWVNIREGRVGVVSLKSPSPLLHAAGISGSLPLAGKPAESSISIARMVGLNGSDLGKITLPLKWDAPFLALKAIDGEIFGLDYKVGGQIALVRGNPFSIDLAVPEQKDREIRIGGNAKAKLGVVMARGRTQGYLRFPASWQGQWILQAMAVDAGFGGRENHFDHGQALLVFQNGTLRCLDARLIGEEASVIGNAMLLSDGRMAGNARIIAAPESLLAFSRLTRPDSTLPPHLTPLSTPQRAALDLKIFGRPDKLFYQPDPRAAPLLLR